MLKDWLKKMRTINNFTQDEIAKKIGISRVSYIRYEKGIIPSQAAIKKIADFYSVDVTKITKML